MTKTIFGQMKANHENFKKAEEKKEEKVEEKVQEKVEEKREEKREEKVENDQPIIIEEPVEVQHKMSEKEKNIDSANYVSDIIGIPFVEALRYVEKFPTSTK